MVLRPHTALPLKHPTMRITMMSAAAVGDGSFPHQHFVRGVLRNSVSPCAAGAPGLRVLLLATSLLLQAGPSCLSCMTGMMARSIWYGRWRRLVLVVLEVLWWSPP
jgi:hypothetical protein